MTTHWIPEQLLEPGVGVILDTETTDLDGRIIEISIIDAATGTVLMDQLINPWDCSSTRPERPSPTTTPMNAAWPANTTAPNSSTTNSAAAQKPPPAQPASQPSTPTPTTRPAIVSAGKPCEPHSGPPSSMSGHTDTRSYTHHETRQAT